MYRNFILLIVLLVTVAQFTSCKKSEAPVEFHKKLAVCDSLYNFDNLAEAGNLDRSSFVRYEDCLCNTIAPPVKFKSDDNVEINLNQLKGKSVVFYTWSDKSSGYYEDLAYLKSLQDKYKGKLVVVALSMFDPAQIPPSLPTGAGSMHNVIFGIEVIRQGFGLTLNFPTAIFIDSKGVVQDFFSGYTYNFRMSKKDREERIDKGISRIM